MHIYALIDTYIYLYVYISMYTFVSVYIYIYNTHIYKTSLETHTYEHICTHLCAAVFSQCILFDFGLHR